MSVIQVPVNELGPYLAHHRTPRHSQKVATAPRDVLVTKHAARCPHAARHPVQFVPRPKYLIPSWLASSCHYQSLNDHGLIYLLISSLIYPIQARHSYSGNYWLIFQIPSKWQNLYSTTLPGTLTFQRTSWMTREQRSCWESGKVSWKNCGSLYARLRVIIPKPMAKYRE